MSDKEKLNLIHKLATNLSPIDFTDEKMGIGVAHALAVAIECITEMDDEDNE